MTWWRRQLESPLLDHVPDLAVDGHRPDVLSATLYPVQLRLWAARMVHENYIPKYENKINWYYTLDREGTGGQIHGCQ